MHDRSRCAVQTSSTAGTAYIMRVIICNVPELMNIDHHQPACCHTTIINIGVWLELMGHQVNINHPNPNDHASNAVTIIDVTRAHDRSAGHRRSDISSLDDRQDDTDQPTAAQANVVAPGRILDTTSLECIVYHGRPLPAAMLPCWRWRL